MRVGRDFDLNNSIRQQHEHQQQTNQRYLAFTDEMDRGLFHPHFKPSPLAPPHSSLSALSTIELETFLSFISISFLPSFPILFFGFFSTAFRRKREEEPNAEEWAKPTAFFKIHFLVINQRIVDDCFFFLLLLCIFCFGFVGSLSPNNVV